MATCHLWQQKRFVVDQLHNAIKAAVWTGDVQRHLPPRRVVDGAAGRIAVCRNSYMFDKYRQNFKQHLFVYGHTHELNNRGQQ